MLIFLYGPDSYGRRQKIKELAGEYRKKHPNLSVESFDFEDVGADAEFSRLKDFFSSPTLFENVKLAVAENILNASKQDKKIKKTLKENLENKDFILIISEESKPTKEFGFLLGKPVLFQEFENPEGERLIQFIKKEAKNRNLEIDAKAISFLAKIFQGDSWGLINELNKLSLLDKKSISIDDLKNFVDYYKPINSSDFFTQIRNFAFSRSLGQKVANLEILLKDEDPAKIFNFLASFASNQPALLKKFADYDVAVKSGKMDYEEVLLDLCF